MWTTLKPWDVVERRVRRFPLLHRRGTSEHSLWTLATVGVEREAWSMGRGALSPSVRPRLEWSGTLEPGGAAPRARKEHSSPTLASPGGLTPNLSRRTLPCPCGV